MHKVNLSKGEGAPFAKDEHFFLSAKDSIIYVSFEGKKGPRRSVLPCDIVLGIKQSNDFVNFRVPVFSSKTRNHSVDFKYNTTKHHNNPSKAQKSYKWGFYTHICDKSSVLPRLPLNIVLMIPVTTLINQKVNGVSGWEDIASSHDPWDTYVDVTRDFLCVNVFKEVIEITELPQGTGLLFWNRNINYN